MTVWFVLAVAAVALLLGSVALEILDHATGGATNGLRELVSLASVVAIGAAVAALAVALGEAILTQLFEPDTYDSDLTFLKLGAALGLLAAGSVAAMTTEKKPKRRLARSRR